MSPDKASPSSAAGPSSVCLRLLSWLDPRRHLAARLAWITIIVVAVYIVTVVVTVNEIATNIVNEKTGNSYADLAFSTSNMLDRIMFERWREAQNIATLPQAYANPGDDGILNTLRSSFTDYAWIGITSVNGTVIASTQGMLHGVDVSARPWWKAGKKGPTVLDLHDALLLANLLPKLPNGDPQRFVDIACPLYTPAVAAVCTNTTNGSGVVATNCTTGTPKTYAGVLGFHLSWIWAGAIRDQIIQSTRAGDGVELFILDRSGLVLLGQEKIDSRPGVYAGMTLSGDAISAAQRGENDYTYDSYPDGDWLTGYSHSKGYRDYPGLGWIVLVRQRRSEAIESAVHLQHITLLIVLLIGFAMIVCLTLAISFAIRPLSLMSNKADQITEQLMDTKVRKGKRFDKGDLAILASRAQIVVALPNTPRQDEVGHLSLSLASLLSVLNVHRHELQNANAQLELKVQQRTVELEMINRELEMFSQTVSHDLRAPLHSIRSSSELLQQDLTPLLSDAPPTVTEYIEQIQSDVTTANRLITDLLELSRINHSQMRPKAVDLAAIAHELVSDLRRHDPDRSPNVTVILPDRTPIPSELQVATPQSPMLTTPPPAKDDPAIPLVGKFVAQCDEGLVRVVLTNLLSNAWKYSSKKSHSVIELGVTSYTHDPSKRVYYVRDNGAGFDLAHARRLFKPFQRMHSQSEFKGVGVGLSTVSRCCQRHGGRVWAKSAKNRGATFFFTLEPMNNDSTAPVPADDGTGGGVGVVDLPPLPSEEAVMAAIAANPPSATEKKKSRTPTPTIRIIGPDQPSDSNDADREEHDSSLPTVRFHEMPDEVELTSIPSPSMALPTNPKDGLTISLEALPAAAAPTDAASPTSPSSPSAVIMDLPGESTTAVGKKPIRRKHRKSDSTESSTPTSVLLVDDSFINCKLGSRILSSNGMLVDTANDGVDALKLLYPTYHPDRDHEHTTTTIEDDSHGFESQSQSADSFQSHTAGASSALTHISDAHRGTMSPVKASGRLGTNAKLAKLYDIVLIDLEMPVRRRNTASDALTHLIPM